MSCVRHLLLVVALCAASCQSAPDPEPPPPAAPPQATAPTPPPPPPDPRDYTAVVYFDAGSAVLPDAGRRELRGFAAKLRPFPERRVHVAGYSESTDADKSVRWLSEQRAKNVASYLVSQGLPPSHVSVQGLGTAAATTATDPGRPPLSGRRAEVTVR
jgi:outer membrane protein OmpA-like peptidoglycan-associated protein